jgi:tetratricopeptide (TPR) repeat protein
LKRIKQIIFERLKLIIAVTAIITIGAYVYSDHFSDRARARKLTEAADGEFQKGEIEAAITTYSSAIGRDPSFWQAYYGRGQALELKGSRDLASADYSEALRILFAGKVKMTDAVFLAIPNLLAFRGNIRESKGDLDKALSDYAKAIEFNNRSIIAFLGRGRILAIREQFDAAMADFDEAVRNSTDGGSVFWGADNYAASAHFERGMLRLFRFAKPDDAANDLAAALKRASRWRQLARIQKLRDLIAPRHPFVPDGYHLVLALQLARLRTNSGSFDEFMENAAQLVLPHLSPNSQDLSEAEAALKKALGLWPGPVIAFVLGQRGLLDEMSIAELREKAQAGASAEERASRLCDVDFYLGVFALADAKREEARSLLQAAVAGCPPRKREGLAARWELERLQQSLRK